MLRAAIFGVRDLRRFGVGVHWLPHDFVGFMHLRNCSRRSPTPDDMWAESRWAVARVVIPKHTMIVVPRWLGTWMPSRRIRIGDCEVVSIEESEKLDGQQHDVGYGWGGREMYIGQRYFSCPDTDTSEEYGAGMYCFPTWGRAWLDRKIHWRP